MPKNRVERLEAEVSELQSTIDGLTEEVVEAKERIRSLEEQLGTEPQTRVPNRRSSRDDGSDQWADLAAGLDAVEADPDDVAEAAAEADLNTEDQVEDDAETVTGDDIIVA